MIAGFRNRLEAICRDEGGVSFIEFAVVAPILAILILGMADFGRGYTERFFLQQAVNRTLELGHQGTVLNDYSFLIDEAATAANVPASNVTLDQWLECDSGPKTAFNSFCTTGQQTARYVKLTIVKPYKPLFTSSGYTNVQPDGTVRFSANASLRVQ